MSVEKSRAELCTLKKEFSEIEEQQSRLQKENENIVTKEAQLLVARNKKNQDVRTKQTELSNVERDEGNIAKVSRIVVSGWSGFKGIVNYISSPPKKVQILCDSENRVGEMRHEVEPLTKAKRGFVTSSYCIFKRELEEDMLKFVPQSKNDCVACIISMKDLHHYTALAI